MAEKRFVSGWVWAAIVLVAVIIICIVIFLTRYDGDREIEIKPAVEEEPVAGLYIHGEVNNPGSYPLSEEYNITDILGLAGRVTDNADLNHVSLYIPSRQDIASCQKVDINRAEKWLLMALPGIGEIKAEAIITYREKNGLFRSTSELMEVEGIGKETLAEIADLITVGDY
jgi:competence protein ComEA